MKANIMRTVKKIIAGSICTVMIGINGIMFIPKHNTTSLIQTAMVQSTEYEVIPSQTEERISRLNQDIKVTSRGGYSRIQNIEYTIYKFISNGDKTLYFDNLESAELYKTKVLNETVNLAIEIQETKQNIKSNISTEEEINNITTKLISDYKKPTTYYPTISKYISSKYRTSHRPSHTGIDLAGSYGDGIYAYKSGKVISVSYSNSGYGNCIVIEHDDGMQTRYAHLSSIKVKKNEYVNGGQKIGLMGSTGNSTGNHLHFEVIINGKQVNPYSYLKKWL